MKTKHKVIAAAVLTLCLFLCGLYLSSTGKSQAEPSESSQTESSVFSSGPGVSFTPATPEAQSTPRPTASNTPEPEVFDPVGQMTDNPDCIGWLNIPTVSEEIPVMQAAETDTALLYLDSRCNVYESDHLIVYGAQENLLPFQSYTEPDYQQEYPAFVFTDAYERVHYKVFAVVADADSSEEEQNILDRGDFADEPEFVAWLQYVQEKSLYDTGITPEYGDRFMTVSIYNGKLDLP